MKGTLMEDKRRELEEMRNQCVALRQARMWARMEIATRFGGLGHVAMGFLQPNMESFMPIEEDNYQISQEKKETR